MTVGVIGGKTRAYLPMAYGVSTFNLGLTFFLDAGDDYGTDPRGFIGWEDQTKTVFFVGILFMTGVISFCSLIYKSLWQKENVKRIFSMIVVLSSRKISRHFFP